MLIIRDKIRVLHLNNLLLTKNIENKVYTCNPIEKNKVTLRNWPIKPAIMKIAPRSYNIDIFR